MYGEEKVVQPVGDGGFEAAGYFTDSAASHSTGESCIPVTIPVNTSNSKNSLL